MQDKSMDFLIKQKPELDDILNDCQTFMQEDAGNFEDRCWFLYHDIKPRFTPLIGFLSTVQVLNNTSAYDFFYGEVIDILKV